MRKTRPAFWLIVIAALLGLFAQARAEQPVVFASVAEGKRILMTKDAFVERISPFDRAARLKTDREVSESEYLAFVGSAVVEWDAADKSKVQASLQQIDAALSRLFPVPAEPVQLIKTTGQEEAEAAYTRGNAIMLPANLLALPQVKLSRLLAHEFFHVFSRGHPAVRGKLYAAIGFQPCGEVEMPAVLRARAITNPDAPKNEHCIQVGLAGEQVWVLPILFANPPRYDTARGGTFLNYLAFSLLVVDKTGASGAGRPVMDAGGAPKLVDVRQVAGYFEQIGRNTDYIIHPEEILAENVVQLVAPEGNVPSPEVLKRIEGVLAEARAAEPAAKGGRP
jgi:hypothetical protein